MSLGDWINDLLEPENPSSEQIQRGKEARGSCLIWLILAAIVMGITALIGTITGG